MIDDVVLVALENGLWVDKSWYQGLLIVSVVEYVQYLTSLTFLIKEADFNTIFYQ